ncbi:MAG: glycosyltransferase family 4 protein [Nitrospirota bacterium]
MKRLSVAMVVASPFPANHGTPGSIREMAESLEKRGHKIHIVTYHIQQEIPVNGLKIHRIPALFNHQKVSVGPTRQKIFWDMLLAMKLCKVIKRENCDLIHAHNYEGAIAGYIAKLITGRPMIYNAVNTMIDELPSYNFFRPKFIARMLARSLDYTVPKMADHIIAISRELLLFLKDKVELEKISMIPLGIDPMPFQGIAPNIIRERYGIGSKPIIIYTGTIDKFQRIDYLIRAMKMVISYRKDPILLIVANIIDDDALKELKGLAMELNIEKNVIFTDEMPSKDIPYYLAAADIAVAPRPSCPGFPVKLLNYMAAGKAIVTFAGSAKGLRDEENAIIVEDHDYEGMGKGIINLLTQPEFARRLGEKARRFVNENFCLSTISKKINDVYSIAMQSISATKPIFYERRQRVVLSSIPDRRGYERRKSIIPIDFPERRKVVSW